MTTPADMSYDEITQRIDQINARALKRQAEVKELQGRVRALEIEEGRHFTEARQLHSELQRRK